MYTSGSTGQPKGVMVTHHNVVRLVKNSNFVPLNKETRILQTGAPIFDATTFEIWGSLLNGGQLVLVKKKMILDGQRLMKVLRNFKINTLWLTAPLFNQLLQENIELFAPLNYLLLGGDVLSPGHISRVKRQFPYLKIINGYGPTENTTFSTTYLIEKELEQNIPIGRPIANSTAYIYDKSNHLSPIGVPGELYVGGDGVALGYLNNPELTVERFKRRFKRDAIRHSSVVISNSLNFPNDQCPMANGYLYKTGDLGRWLLDGNIEFLGRIDHQVKIRGFRVELGEIESRLLNHTGIKDAVVLVQEEEGGDKYLCAYVVFGGENVVSELREYLSKGLPDYMIPSFFVPLEKIPLNTNGKIDHGALPKPEFKVGESYTAPRNEIEKKLIRLWSEILERDALHGAQLQTSIGIDDNFFQLGGHSLKAAALVSRIEKAFNVKIPLSEIFKNPRIRQLARYIKNAGQWKYEQVVLVEKKEYYVLSSAQKRIYFLQQMDTAGTAYNISAAWVLEGVIDKPALEQSLLKLIRRHESLRTSFDVTGEGPVQRIHEFPDTDEHGQTRTLTEVFDPTFFQKGGAPEAIIKSFIRPFDLSHAPMFRVGLVKLAEEKHIFMVDMHHIISDGISTHVLVQDFSALYSGNALPVIKLQYKDYAEWQNCDKRREALCEQSAYWKKIFEEEISVLDLPTDYARPAIRGFEGKSIKFETRRETTAALKTIALETETTLYMVMLALYTIFLAKLSNREDIVIGTPIAGRTHADLEKIIGMFVNTLALRSYPSGEKGFMDFLGEVKAIALKGFDNQEYQYEDLVEQISINRDPGRNPLFDTMFALQDTGSQKIEIPGLKFVPYEYENKTAKFDLTLTVVEVEVEAKLHLMFEYSTNLFSEATIERFTVYFNNIMQGVIENTREKIFDLKIITDAERRLILFGFNDTKRGYPKDKTIHQLFAEQVERTPDHVSLVRAGSQTCPGCITYRQLNEKSDRLAGLLIEKGIQPDTIVGIMMERSVEMIIGIMGILKSGGAYLPIDPEYPQERIEYMLKDSSAKILIKKIEIQNPNDQNKNQNFGAAFVLNFENLNFEFVSNFVLRASKGDLNASNLAYLIYTSGTTGKPKGVMIEHRAVHNFMEGIVSIIEFRPGKTILALTTVTFDIFGLETLLPFCRGLKVVMADENHQREMPLLTQLIINNCVDMLQSTPTRMQMFTMGGAAPSCLENLKEIMVGGEVFPVKLLEDLKQSSSARIYNMYGPTETTIWSSVSEVTAAETITVGHPIANTQIYILNKYSKIQTVGVAGELHIGGDGLARGYINRPELTVEKFVDFHHSSFIIHQSNLYRTGDLARWLDDGNIEFLGRIDHQVKIRGYRIELGEIEHQLLSYDGIKAAAVIVMDEGGENNLCAHFTSDKKIEIPELRAYLAKKLPSYMIPSYFNRIERMPLTTSGKVDRKVLAAIGHKNDAEIEFVAPQNETEKIVAAVWQEVLGVERVGIYDNFFHIGGNSLKLITLSAKLNTVLGANIPVAKLFEHVTISAFARYYAGKESEGTSLGKIKDESMTENHKVSRTVKEIAIIGMAGRFPGAKNIDEFWNNLKNGIESITFMTDEELVNSVLDPGLIKNPNYVKARGGVLEDKDCFDAAFFDYTAPEARIMDPQTRIFHECAWEAFENAGYNPYLYGGLIGVYAGASTSIYWESLLHFSGANDDLGRFATNQLASRDFLCTRIAYKLDLKGPTVNIQTACSTSLVAVHYACRAILDGECDMAIAGGISVSMENSPGYLYQEGMILSPDGHCRAFDAGSKGTIGGNGVGIVVLKPLMCAVEDGDSIQAIIRGTAINNDGLDKAGYTAPSVKGQAAVIQTALQMAKVDPETVTYVETHGTGTTLGDPIEIEALTQAYHSDKKKYCAVGSVKTNIGHLDAAAGIAGLIKTVLALKNKLIPPSLHYKKANPKIDFENSPFFVNAVLKKWKNENEPRLAGVSSFGIGGANAHVILEEAPPIKTEEKNENLRLILLSARTESALEKMAHNLAEFLLKNSGTNLGDAAYTLQVGRNVFEYKRSILCDNVEGVVEALSSLHPGNTKTFFTKDKKPPVILMFHGQGAQYVNMGLELYRNVSIFRDEMNRCFEILKPLVGYDLKEILFPVEAESDELPGRINITEITQPVIFAFEYALAKLLMAWGIKPYAMIGHSIGEYTAACLAGVFSLEDALRLVSARGRLINQMPGGSMLSVPLAHSELEPLLNQELSLAAVNGPTHCVVSGTHETINAFEKQLQEKGYDSSRLHTSHAFHSKMMDPVLKEFENLVSRVSLNKPGLPYISNVTGNWITVQDVKEPAYWAAHLRKTVRFADGLSELLKIQNAIFVEVGPGKSLSTFVRQHPNKKDDQAVLNLVRHPKENVPDKYYLINQLGQLWLYGVKIDWNQFYSDEKRNRIPLPTYPFEKHRFWFEGNPFKLIEEKLSGQLHTTGKLNVEFNNSLEEGTIGPTHDKRSVLSTPFSPPATEIQRILVDIWENYFGIKPVGIEDDFFELGGDSLKAMTIISKIYKQSGVEIPIGKFFNMPTINKLSKYIIEHAGSNAYTKLEPVEKKEYYALSASQKRLYILQQMVIDSTGYNMPSIIPLAENIEEAKLEPVFKRLIEKHESLRTSFMIVNEKPVQKINYEINFSINYFKIKEKADIVSLISNFTRPFNLNTAPLLRVNLVAVGLSYRFLFIDMHHIITDGISQGILANEFQALYSGEETQPLRLQYKDYSDWHNSAPHQEAIKHQEIYWLNEFSDEIPVINLPNDYQRPLEQSFEGNKINFKIKKEEIQALKAIALSESSTLFIVLMAIFNILLSKLSGQEDIVIGTPIAGRKHADLEKIIGMFVNTISLRNYPYKDRRFRDFLGDVKERTLLAFENQEYPFEELVDKLSLKRDISRNPLFDIMFVLQNMNTGLADQDKEPPIEPSQSVEVDSLKENENIFWAAKFDLTLSATERDEGLFLSFSYCIKLFKKETIERFIAYFKKIVSIVLKYPGISISISEIDILSEEEKNCLLYEFNDTETDYPKDKTIHRLVEEQAERTPDNIVLHGSMIAQMPGEEGAITYKELNEKSHRLAHELQTKGVGPDTIVGIMIERSVEMIIGIMGILKSGGAYLPIDPEYPQERVNYMLQDSAARILINKSEIRNSKSRVQTNPNVQNSNDQSKNFEELMVLNFDNLDLISLKGRLCRGLNHSSFIIHHSNQLAYIIYTSGSTGKPKGVMVEHASILNTIYWRMKEYKMGTGDTVLQLFSAAFDGFLTSFFTPAVSGAAVVQLTGDEIKNIFTLKEIIVSRRITHFISVPSLYKSLLDIGSARELSALKIVTLAGEAVHPGIVEISKRLNPGLEIINEYGPTESSVLATMKRHVCPGKIISIGEPIANVGIYIIDAYEKLVPIGIPGEITIRGKGLARGYLNNPELTANKFTNCRLPVAKIYLRSKRYKTGDLARWLADGNIEFLGRIDQQVKIRGFRIELGEIENRLLNLGGIKEAVVLAREENEGDKDKYICAYFVSDREYRISELREFLSRELPDYMIPAYFVQMEEIPVTLNGKVDRRALPKQELKAGEGYTAPGNEIEKKLVDLWAEILGRDELHTSQLKTSVGIDDNFFELGGHSLKATILVAKIHKIFDVKVQLAEIFNMPTIKEFANYLKGKSKEFYISIEPAEEKEYYLLSSAQKRLYILQQMNMDSTAYNVPAIIPLHMVPDIGKIEDIFKRLINRHDSLRTSFHIVDNTPVQVVYKEIGFKLDLHVLSGDHEPQNFIKQFIRPFDLTKAPLIRAALIIEMDNRSILIVDMHHVMSDGVSHQILVNEFLDLYVGEDLDPLRIQYKDFSQWQNGEIEKENFKRQEAYWLKEFEGEIPVLELPIDFPRPVEQNFEGNNINFEIKEEETHALELIASSEGSTLFMVAMTINNILLSKLSGQEDIVIGTSIAGRRHVDLEKIIGMFVNTLPLRNYPIGEQTFRDFLEDVKERTLMAFENQEYPFERLVEKVVLGRDMGRNPLFVVMFDLLHMDTDEGRHNIKNNRQDKPGSQKKYENILQTAKFDLTINAIERDGKIFLSFQYCTKLFKKETVERFIVYFKKIVSIAIKEPGIKLSEMEIISEEEKKRALYEFNDTQTEYPRDKTIHQLFEEQVEQAPENIAVVALSTSSNDESPLQITYKQLNENSNRLAYVLQSKGVEPDTIIGIMVERSVEMIIGIMGILKSGGAYLPIDPEYPPERIEYMLKDSGAELLVTTNNKESEKVRRWEGEKVLLNHLSFHHSSFIVHHSSHLAYIIYTSGSTGKPKGVLTTHANVTRVVRDANYIEIEPGDRLLQLSNYAFDGSVFDIYGALLNGAALVMINKDDILEVERFSRVIKREGITVFFVTTALFNTLTEMAIGCFDRVRKVLFGGERVSVEHAGKALEYLGKGRIIHVYGPTETTVYATYYFIDSIDAAAGNIPIGKPISNTTVYIFDKHLNPVPIAVPGEIYIGGAGIARGYLNNPELTADKFINIHHSILYRTGDLARFLSSGDIEFLGRIDHQIKIRGFRIELGEVENTLIHHQAIEECAAVCREVNGENRLIAYYKEKNKIELWPSLAEYFAYDDLIYHSMINDDSRNEKYRNAIRKAVKGKVVLEIGPGREAILSRFCIEEGAKKVYAVEILESAYQMAKKIIQELKLEDKIILIHGDITKIILPEKVDCCVSEIVGSVGGSEGAAKILNDAHSLMKAPYMSIPSKSLTQIAAITLPENEFEYSFEEVGAHYIEKIFNQVGRKFDLRLGLLNFHKKHIISNPDVFEELDFTRENPLESEHDIYLEIIHKSILRGFVVWLKLYCDEEELIDTIEEKYIWLPIYLPCFSEGITVEKGDYIKARVIRKLSGNNLNPDFLINGRLCKKDMNPIDFLYHFPHINIEYKSNDFYKKIFSTDKLNITGKITSGDLREFLSHRLPDYMIPSFLIQVEKIPLTANGKIDRAALYSIGIEIKSKEEYVAPRNEIEQKIAQIWKEVLKLENVGICENFFDLGGTSLDIIKLNSKFKEVFDEDETVVQMFRYPTIRSFGEYLIQKRDGIVDNNIHRPVPINKMKQARKNQKNKRIKGGISNDY